MTTLLISFSAVYNVTIQVEASDYDEGIASVKAGSGTIIEEMYDRPHPETEFEVVAVVADERKK